MVVTVRELDDLLREDVRRELEQLHHALPVYAIDINDPFLSSRLFGTGWDDPQMAGYACWYNLQQIFSWLAAMGWQVILHTGVTTRSDLLQRFLQLAANHFPPATLNSWRIKQHLFDQHHGALFPLVDAFRSRSGPDAEDYQWLMHQARPALSVDEARLDGYWLRIDSLQSNALVLYEFTPQLSSGADPAP